MARRKHHTRVSIAIRLENGTRFSSGWTTPRTLGKSAGQCMRWAKEEMRRDKIEGRSKIESYTVTVQKLPGEFE